MRKTTFVYIFCISAIFISCTNAITSQDLTNYVKLITKLKYGDPCSWEAEKIRQNFAKKSTNGTLTLTAKLRLVQKFMSLLSRRGEGLCSALELTVCSKATRTCVCGDPGLSVLRRQISKHPGFVLETAANGQQKCRWGENSYCVSEDFYQKTAGTFATVDSKCKQGTSCLSMENQQSCTFGAIQQYAMDNLKIDPLELSKDIFSGKICKCQKSEQIDTTYTRQMSRVRRLAGGPRELNSDVDIYSSLALPFTHFV